MANNNSVSSIGMWHFLVAVVGLVTVAGLPFLVARALHSGVEASDINSVLSVLIPGVVSIAAAGFGIKLVSDAARQNADTAGRAKDKIAEDLTAILGHLDASSVVDQIRKGGASAEGVAGFHFLAGGQQITFEDDGLSKLASGIAQLRGLIAGLKRS